MSRYFPLSVFSFISRLYRSVFLRIILIIAILICLAYYILLLPWLNRSLSEQYLQQTGHQLQHDKLNLQLFRCNVSVDHLKDGANLWQARSIDIDLACMRSIKERGLVINEIKIRQLNTNLTQNENGLWNFNEVLKHQQSIPRAEKPEGASLPVVIKKVTLTNATVHSTLADFNQVHIDATPLTLTINNIDSRAHGASQFVLKSDINKSAKISLSGQINMSSLSGEVDLNAQNIPFVWFNALLAPYVRLEVLSGAIELKKRIEIEAGVPKKISGHGKITDLKLRPTSMEQDAVKWKSLEWQNAQILLAEGSIHVPFLALDQLDGQFIIDKDRKTNVQAMIVQPMTTSEVATTTVSATNASTQKPWQFAVDHLAIHNAAVGFYDQSLIPSFTAIVQNFSGDIRSISSDENVFASIDMKGNVDGYAPVSLNGKGNLFGVNPELYALLSFKQMDMGALSPYSAEYAGWKINKGLLSADLNYHYEDGKILGKNHVIIDHLEFGEKVRGHHTLDIPLRLGLAMLTDANGIAVLNTEIAGTPSDPQFKFREVIIRALGNSLKKIVTSPFKFISNLLNTKEDLGKIQFVVGESQLGNAAKEKLQLLTAALNKRPKMRLSVQGTYDQNADLRALKEEQVKTSLQRDGLAVESLKSRDTAWAELVNLKYAMHMAKNSDSVSSTEEKYQALIALEQVDSERLIRLAHERAQAVKQYFILQLGVEGDRVLINSESRCEKAEQCATSEAVFAVEV